MGASPSTGTVGDIYKTYKDMPIDIADAVKDKVVTFKCVVPISEEGIAYLFKSIEPIIYDGHKYYICCFVSNDAIDSTQLHKDCKAMHVKNAGRTQKEIETVSCPKDISYIPKTHSIIVSDGFDNGFAMDNEENLKFHIIYLHNLDDKYDSD